MRRFAFVAPILALGFLTGCASIVDGTNQPISVKTVSDSGDLPGAACQLNNGKGAWFVQTPGSIVVHRAYSDLTVKCTKDGFAPATQTVTSATKPMALGDAIFGGVIGVGVDTADGAAFDYPTLITVIMHPASTPVAEASPALVAASK